MNNLKPKKDIFAGDVKLLTKEKVYPVKETPSEELYLINDLLKPYYLMEGNIDYFEQTDREQ